MRAITSAAGVKLEAALYRPFGEQSEWVLPGNTAPETKGWIGERFDADAGLQYLNARYYDPELSLFLQPDWFEVTKPGVGPNRFSYSFNDPVNKFDPGGNQAFDTGNLEAEYEEISKYIDEAHEAIANGEDISDEDLDYLYGLRADVQTRLEGAFAAEQLMLNEMSFDAAKEWMKLSGGKLSGPVEKIADQLLTGVRKNYAEGARRQAEVVADMKKLHPDASVQTEQYLRDINGKIIKSSAGSGRRLDVVVIQDGKIVGRPIEVTSENARKGAQIRKEVEIHNNNEKVFVRDRTTGKLVEVTGLISDVVKRP